MNKYSTLKSIGWLFKIIGWVVAALSVLGFLLSCLGLVVGFSALDAYQDVVSPVYGVILSFFILIASLIYAAFLIAIGELIDLLIDMSLSTQRSAYLLEQALSRQQKAPAQPHR